MNCSSLCGQYKSKPYVGIFSFKRSDTDEAQSRAVRAGVQAHEDSCRLHDMAVRDAQ